jgi:stage III sporulation protein AA
VVDQRGELFLDHFQLGRRMDILTGCPKKQGVEMILRTMGPTCIGMDEITAKEDCEALLHGAWCGIRLIATAHAGSVKDFISRPVYRPLVESGIFDRVIVMDRDKRWREERVMP